VHEARQTLQSEKPNEMTDKLNTSRTPDRLDFDASAVIVEFPLIFWAFRRSPADAHAARICLQSMHEPPNRLKRRIYG